LFDPQQIQWGLLGRAVHANVGNVAQSAHHLAVGGAGIEQQSILCQAAGQRIVEAAAQVAIEPLDLALGTKPQ
jgi:hypothetical protein